MGNVPQIFNYAGNEVRTVLIEHDVWFVAKDVCEILELSNPTVAIGRLDEDEVTKFNLGGLSGEINIINEAGLYSLILGSRKQEAKQFKRWITHEVIPSIRKHGAYLTPTKVDDLLKDPDTFIKLLTTIKEERQEKELLQQKIETDRPKILFVEALETSKHSILIGELAKLIGQNGINIGQNRLFRWMRDNGYLIRKKGETYNTPTQRSIQLGLMEIKKGLRSNPDGTILETKTTKITPKGQRYFINKFIHNIQEA